MADYAHTETDKRIADLEKRLSEEYRQAYKETKDKLEKYLSDFKRKDEKKRQEVENGTLSEKDYKTWRRNQMLTGQRWADMVDTLAKDMNNANVTAARIVSGEMPEAFSLNANYSEYEIENGYRQNYGFTLYDRDTVDRLVSENPDLLPEPSVDIPADLRWNKQKIVSNITQAVLQGKSIPEIAKSMETVVGMNKASAVRNARTAMTGAQNAGRQQAYERAAAMGIKLQKEWIATLDGRTRHSHGKADGQKVDINGMFSVGGCKMRYPGDVQNGTAAEIYNCRCTMCTVEPPEIMQGEEPRMTYSEWVQTKEGQAATGGRYAQKPLDNGGGSGIMKETTKAPAKTLSLSNLNEFEEWQNKYYDYNSGVSFSREDNHNIFIYTGGAYDAINALERGGEQLEKAKRCYRNGLSEYEGTGNKISEELSKFKLPEPINVRRAVGNVDYITGATSSVEDMKNSIGKVFTEKGFTSTTVCRDTILPFGYGSTRTVLDIYVPTNSRGAYIYKISEHPAEFEYLLDKNTKFKIVDAGEREVVNEFTGDTTIERFMKLEVIPDD